MSELNVFKKPQSLSIMNYSFDFYQILNRIKQKHTIMSLLIYVSVYKFLQLRKSVNILIVTGIYNRLTITYRNQIFFIPRLQIHEN